MRSRAVSLFLAAGLALALLSPARAAAEGIGATEERRPALSGPAGSAVPEEALGSLVRVRTRGRGDFIGTLFAAEADRLELLGEDGAITLVARSEIVGLERLDRFADPAFRLQDAAANRLILMPTGFSIPRGELRVASQEIAAVTTSWGLGDRVSLWGGVSVPGALLSLRWAAPLGDRAALSFGSFVGATWAEFLGIVLPYSVLSLGHPNRNFTLGLGLPLTFSESEALGLAGVVAALGGKFPVSRGAALITENWVAAMPGSEGGWATPDIYLFPGLVFRIAGARLSWDIGAIVPLALRLSGGVGFGSAFEGPVVPLPLLSVEYWIK